ncbi:MAG TPA: winged helix-turn-helix domain-containing protein [Acidimicrobiales bacterium]|jgi:DNA-binding response OmpR family regulator|nr:winged helix-turn-helix domain-containing protein [Acidimicrobiales bacterium]
MEVAHVRWPEERWRREQLRRQGRPRILLVGADTTPPSGGDCLEDWIRVPVDDLELESRSRGLLVRTRHHRPVPPALEGGVLRVGSRWVSLSPLETRLAALLVERSGTVVSRDALTRAGWPDGSTARNTLDVHAVRLRRRLASVGLAIRTVRGRGYLLEPSGSVQDDVHEA